MVQACTSFWNLQTGAMDLPFLYNLGLAVTHQLFFWNSSPAALSVHPLATASYTQWCKEIFITLGMVPPPRPAHQFRHIGNMFAYYCKLTTEEREHFGWAQGTGKQAGQQQTSYNFVNVPMDALRKLALRGQDDRYPFWAPAHLIMPVEVFDAITLGKITAAAALLRDPDWKASVKSQGLYPATHAFTQESELVNFFDSVARAIIQDSTQLPEKYWDHVVYRNSGWHTAAGKAWRDRNTPGVRYLQALHARYKSIRDWEEGRPVRLEMPAPPDFFLPGLVFEVAIILPRPLPFTEQNQPWASSLGAPMNTSPLLFLAHEAQPLPPPLITSSTALTTQRAVVNFPSNLLAHSTGCLDRTSTLPPTTGAMDAARVREESQQRERDQRIADAACKLYYEKRRGGGVRGPVRKKEVTSLQAYLHWSGWSAGDAHTMRGWPPGTERGLAITRKRMNSLTIFSSSGGYGERRQAIHKFVRLVMETKQLGRDEACGWADRERLKIEGCDNRLLTGGWMEQLLPHLGTSVQAFRATGKWKQH